MVSEDITENRQTFILDFDDFIIGRPGFELLQKLKEHYPDFKCTLFTLGFHLGILTRNVKLEKFKKWGQLVKENQDWIEIAPHGFSHIKGEMLETRKDRIEIIIKSIERIFDEFGFNWIKVFKAPYWEISKEAEGVLKDMGYTLAIDRNNPKIQSDIPVYVFNWSIHELLPNYPIIKGHGHLAGSNNGLERCLPNLLKIPPNAQFKFISEYLKNNAN